VRDGPSSRRRIYLDNNATTEVVEPVRKAMLPFLGDRSGNPSSIHGLGRQAREAVETARRSVARLLGCRPRRIVFTGSGSASDNLALKGAAFTAPGAKRHIVTSTIEHPAVLETCRFLERAGFRITLVDVDGGGRVDPGALHAALDDETFLVSIMTANNEVGTIQPVKELCAVAHERGALFHTDAVQAAGKIPIDVSETRADLVTVSAHKIHGPKGIGALYIREGLELEALVHGGGQEAGLSSGTENVPAIVGFGAAAELARRALGQSDEVQRLRDLLEKRIRDLVPGAVLNGVRTGRLPNTLNLTLPGLRGESLVIALDRHGVSLSSGSACKSGSPKPTHVLLAMGKSEEDAHCSVRFSLSRETREEDVAATALALDRVLEEMETTVRFLACK
jgi:cysteine desulfurase NifS